MISDRKESGGLSERRPDFLTSDKASILLQFRWS